MIAILKYNAGNIGSVQNALKRLNTEAVITDEPSVLKSADKIIIPGVGEAGSAMHYLRERKLDTLIQSFTQPVLGICLGLQILCRHSEEKNTDCIGVFDAAVKLFPPGDIIPHMGWNNLRNTTGPLFQHIAPDADFYFVHSYAATLNEDSTGICDYIIPFSAAMQKNNFYATQFHPEKSASAGEQLLKNFLAL